MIQELYRTIKGTYDFANTAIIFDSNPFLLANNELTLYFTNVDERNHTTVTSVNANTAVVDFSSEHYDGFQVTAQTPNYTGGMTGPQETFSWKFTNPPNALIQVSSDGGTSNVALQVSTNDRDWLTLAFMSITEVNANSAYMNVTVPWPYGRLNLISIQAGKTVTANKVV
jgi:hypothetical protein